MHGVERLRILTANEGSLTTRYSAQGGEIAHLSLRACTFRALIINEFCFLGIADYTLQRTGWSDSTPLCFNNSILSFNIKRFRPYHNPS